MTGRPNKLLPALAGLVLLAGTMSGCNSSPQGGNGGRGLDTQSAAVIAPPGATVSEVCLRADAYTLNAGAVGTAGPIPMWGFVLTGTGAGCGFSGGGGPNRPSVVVPTITAAEGSYLNVHLQNNLAGGSTAYTEPVSISIPGQTFFGSDAPGSPGPTWTDGTTGPRQSPAQRVRSFTVEAPLGSGGPGATITYAFGPLRAGTYLLQSGTHPGVQVQMGLVAALVVQPASPGRAYPDPSSAFDGELTLLFSEIDPAFHAAVASGEYGPNPNGEDPPPAGWVTSPIDYHPKYFLVNGAPYRNGPPFATVPGNSRLLLRFLNAGLDTKAPVAGGRYQSVIAEDGNFYSVSGSLSGGARGTCPAPRVQTTILLAAGKTVDAIVSTPPGSGNNSLAVYDRRGNVSNAGAWPGGLMARINIAGGGSTPPGPAVAPCALVGP